MEPNDATYLSAGYETLRLSELIDILRQQEAIKGNCHTNVIQVTSSSTSLRRLVLNTVEAQFNADESD